MQNHNTPSVFNVGDHVFRTVRNGGTPQRGIVIALDTVRLADGSTCSTADAMLTTKAYDIVMADYQIRLLIDALKAHLPSFANTPSNVNGWRGSDRAEAQGLIDMLTDLPTVEMQSPGCTHGLCI